MGDYDVRFGALAAAIENAMPVGFGHLQAVDHHERLDDDVEMAPAQAQHVRYVRLLKEQFPGEFVVLFIEGAAGDEDTDGVGHGSH